MKKFLILTALICASLLSDCSVFQSLTRKTPRVSEMFFPADTLRTAFEMQDSENRIGYVGPFSKTLSLDENSVRLNSYFGFHPQVKRFNLGSAEPDMWVDTKQEIVLKNYDVNLLPPPENGERVYLPENFRAFPAFIRNTTADTLFLDNEDGRLTMIREARDASGEWKPIEYWNHSLCGNSFGQCIIPPGNLAVIKIPHYGGNYKTKMRLKCQAGGKVYYSQTFVGRMNKAQFEVPDRFKEHVEDPKFREYLFLGD